MQISKSAVFIVESPFQVLCAIEAISYYQLLEVLVVVKQTPNRIGNHTQITKSLELIPKFCPDVKLAVEYLNINSTYKTVLKDFFEYIRLIRNNKERFDLVAIGDIRIPWIRNLAFSLRGQKYVLLDDGMATFEGYKNVIEEGNFRYRENYGSRPKDILKTILTLFLKPVRGPTPHIDKFCMFTAFIEWSEHIEIDKNTFECVKKGHEYSLKENVCFFWGGPLSERGVLDHLKIEINLICKVNDFFKKRNIDFIYISHRDDSEKKLSQLRSANIQVMELGQPAELYFSSSSKLPKFISGFYSSTLMTLPKIVPNIVAWSFVIPEAYLTKKYKDVVTNCYEKIRLHTDTTLNVLNPE